ncbi:MAG: LysM peptidoglycan-binding domain-containing protein [Bacteroidota bacterium]
MKRLLILFPLLLIHLLGWAQTQVPSGMVYCGVNLTFTDESRLYIQQRVNEYQSSHTYFYQMVERAVRHFPFIEEALRDEGVPDDLKFLCIQESAVKPHAVSTSNAVGFWQFKEATALEMGLQVTDYIDERKHIYQATRAAARYFAKANGDFNNWLYAIISYYQGPTGAIPHTDPRFYGKNFMVIEQGFHIYVLKAIAHKIAYQEAINTYRKSAAFFMPFATQGETQWRELIQKHQVTSEEFLEANPWISRLDRVPSGGPFTYYISIPSSRYMGHIEDPTKAGLVAYETPEQELPKEEKTPATWTPTTPPKPVVEEADEPNYFSDEAQPIEGLPRKSYALFDVEDDLHYPQLYSLYHPEEDVQKIAIRASIPVRNILKWNEMDKEEELEEAKLLYLTPPHLASFHIVEEGDRLHEIATKYGMSLSKLLKKNRIDPWEMTFYVGQKLYLKGKKPKGEKMIILRMPEPEAQSYVDRSPPPGPKEQPVTSIQKPVKKVTPVKKVKPAFQPLKTRWVQHRVTPGESLWSISRQYGTKVEIIKRINQINTNELTVGQELQIVVNELER